MGSLLIKFRSRVSSIFVCLFFFHFALISQTDRIFLPAQDELLEDYYIIEQTTGLKSGNLQDKVNLKDFCPKVGDQKTTGSCASFASAYAAVTISHAIANSIQGSDKISTFAFSPSFVYNQLNQENCTDATSIVETLEFLQNTGVCLNNEFTFTPKCDRFPDETHLSSAQNFKIDFAATIFKGKVDPLEKIDMIKSYLNDSIPVISILQVYDTFVELKAGKKYWHHNRDWDNYLGGHHVITVVGYDEKDGCFEIMNSWGTKWGNKGYTKIPFEDFADISTIGMILKVDGAQLSEKVDVEKLKQEELVEIEDELAFNDDAEDAIETVIEEENSISNETSHSTPVESVQEENTAEPNSDEVVSRTTKPKRRKVIKYKLRSEFDVNKLYFFNDNLIKRKIKFEYDSDKQIYNSSDIAFGDAMQLYLENISKGNYIYILSIDPTKKLNFHWPKNREVKNDKLIRQNLLSNSFITIPSEESVLQKNFAGTERIFILNSNYALDNILNGEDAEVLSFLNEIAEKDRSGVNYITDEIKFVEEYTRGDKIIVPLILHLN